MDSFGVPFPRMDWDSTNLTEAWRHFSQHAQLMFTGPLREKEEADKCSYLLLWIGEKGRDIFNTWTLTQGEQESIEEFVTELKLLAKDCGYQHSDEMVRDRIVFATNSPHLREKLHSQGAELTLEKTTDIARFHELAKQQLKIMGSARDHDAVHAVSRKPFRWQKTHNTAKPIEHDTQRTCSYCAGQHSYKDVCPAKGKQCVKCKKFNHFAKACRSKPATQPGPHRKSVHTVKENEVAYKEDIYEEEAVRPLHRQHHHRK